MLKEGLYEGFIEFCGVYPLQQMQQFLNLLIVSAAVYENKQQSHFVHELLRGFSDSLHEIHENSLGRSTHGLGSHDLILNVLEFIDFSPFDLLEYLGSHLYMHVYLLLPF